MTQHEFWVLAATATAFLGLAAGYAVGYLRSYRRAYQRGMDFQDHRWRAWLAGQYPTAAQQGEYEQDDGRAEDGQPHPRGRHHRG